MANLKVFCQHWSDCDTKGGCCALGLQPSPGNCFMCRSKAPVKPTAQQRKQPPQQLQPSPAPQVTLLGRWGPQGPQGPQGDPSSSSSGNTPWRPLPPDPSGHWSSSSSGVPGEAVAAPVAPKKGCGCGRNAGDRKRPEGRTHARNDPRTE